MPFMNRIDDIVMPQDEAALAQFKQDWVINFPNQITTPQQQIDFLNALVCDISFELLLEPLTVVTLPKNYQEHLRLKHRWKIIFPDHIKNEVTELDWLGKITRNTLKLTARENSQIINHYDQNYNRRYIQKWLDRPHVITNDDGEEYTVMNDSEPKTRRKVLALVENQALKAAVQKFLTDNKVLSIDSFFDKLEKVKTQGWIQLMQEYYPKLYVGIMNTAGESALTMKDSSGNSLLHFAAMDADIDGMQLLIQEGADLFAMNHQNKTPLKIAIDNKEISNKAILSLIKQNSILDMLQQESSKKLVFQPQLGAILKDLRIELQKMMKKKNLGSQREAVRIAVATHELLHVLVGNDDVAHKRQAVVEYENSVRGSKLYRYLVKPLQAFILCVSSLFLGIGLGSTAGGLMGAYIGGAGAIPGAVVGGFAGGLMGGYVGVKSTRLIYTPLYHSLGSVVKEAQRLVDNMEKTQAWVLSRPRI